MVILPYVHEEKMMNRDVYVQGRRQEALVHAPLGALCDCSTPYNRECIYRENVHLEGTPSALQRRKVYPKSPSNDDRTAPSLDEVAPS